MAGGGSAGTREAPHPHQYKSKDVARYVHFNLDDVPETGNFLTDVSSMALGCKLPWPSFSFPVKWLNPEAVFLVECT